MTTLGDDIRKLRALRNEAITALREYIDGQIVHDLQTYADRARDIAKNYADQLITEARQYVDNQINQAKTVGKNYTDQQIAKLKADNNLI